MDLVEVLRTGEDAIRGHDRSPQLTASARMFLDCVAGWEHFTVEAASPAAERVLGAAMMLEPQLQGGRSARTVVLDVNIASGTLVANAARRVRDAIEPEWLIAVVINALTEVDLRWSIEGVDTLFVCRSESDRQQGQPGEHSIGVRLP
ncbi:hypothetical protein [Pseudoclavibacter sp. 8L]|uniref:hypothetical protein n=1 Tax=Pseudoclavibacter sp. 8L TaxID=2653162 RepID=UPI0012F4441E|nr:hypothetical protein [Pseudoclavibacter sp. 8L]VXC09767.1 hypothetical protein PSCLAVI8L_320103 [Pseudoclavibacter sp. 8L]